MSSDLGYKDTDWLERARYGLHCRSWSVPSRSHTGAFCLKDAKGRALSGEHRYTITFDLNDMPPVTEFWEIPLYDREGYFYDNPIDRYSINSYMLKRGKLHTADGKLVIYVQNDEPKDAEPAQELAAGAEGRLPVCRSLLRSDGPLIDGSYNMPGVVRVD